jgi:hypothetical protein
MVIWTVCFVPNRPIAEHRKLARSNVRAMNDLEFEVHLLAGMGEKLKSDFDKMSVGEIWLLRDKIIEALRQRITVTAQVGLVSG